MRVGTLVPEYVYKILNAISNSQEIPTKQHIKDHEWWPNDETFERAFAYCKDEYLLIEKSMTKKINEKSKTELHYELSNKGLKFMLDYIRIEELRKHDKTIKEATIAIAFFTAVSAIITILNWLNFKIQF